MVRVMTEGTELIVSRKNLVCNLGPHCTFGCDVVS